MQRRDMTLRTKQAQPGGHAQPDIAIAVARLISVYTHTLTEINVCVHTPLCNCRRDKRRKYIFFLLSFFIAQRTKVEAATGTRQGNKVRNIVCDKKLAGLISCDAAVAVVAIAVAVPASAVRLRLPWATCQRVRANTHTHAHTCRGM